MSKLFTRIHITAACIALTFMSFRQREVEDSYSIDWQVALKFIPIASLACISSLGILHHIRRIDFKSPLGLLCALLIWKTLGLLYSYDPIKGLYYLLLQWMFVVVVISTIDQASSGRKLIRSILFILIIVSTAVFPFPDFWMQDYLLSGDKFMRFSGALGGPVGMSQASAIASGYILTHSHLSYKNKTWLCALPLFLLWETLSRGQSVGLFLGLVLTWAILRMRWFYLAAIGITSIIIFSTIDLNFLFSAFNRSGNATDFTSLTSGRTSFWPFVIDLIRQSPIIGYGTGSSNVVLYQWITTDFKPTHAHNLLLQCLLENGIIGALFMIPSLITFLIIAIRQKMPFAIFLSVLILIGGMSDPFFYGPDLLFTCFVILTVVVHHETNPNPNHRLQPT